MRDAALQGLAVGFFDGVHLGHQAILRGASAALTFRNHPRSVLAPERAPRLIMTCEERVAAIRECGVGEVTVLDFTRELAELSPEAFAANYLSSSVSRLPSCVRCGANWRFGRGGAGDAAFLRRLGFSVEVAPYVEHGGGRISSSRIREALERGEIEEANAMMGRRFKVQGSRFRGKGVGMKIGFPTLNLELSTLNLRLPLGVYAVEVAGLRGIANYGLAPTMGDGAWRKPVMEVHFPGAGPEDVRRQTSDEMTVSLIRFIRPERKFSSVEELQRQIELDCSRSREDVLFEADLRAEKGVWKGDL